MTHLKQQISLIPWAVVLPAGLRQAQPCRYCFYSVVQKWVFRSAGATRCPNKREIWNGGAALTGDSSALLLRNSELLYASTGSFYVFSLVAFGGTELLAFSRGGSIFFIRFSIAPSGETTDRIKKLGGAKILRTSSITMRSTVGFVGGAGCRQKSDFFICHAFEWRRLW